MRLTREKVLASRESVAGQQDLFDQDEDSDTVEGTVTETSRKRRAAHTPSGSEAGDAGSESDDYVQVKTNDVKGQAHAAKESDEDMEGEPEDDSASDSDVDDEEAPDMDEANAQLNAALGELFKTKGFDAAMPDQGEDDSSDTEEMDDEQMFQLDEQMAHVFRERLKRAPNKKQGQKEARGNVVQLKNRALDFLEIYIKQEYLNHLCLTTLLPLLKLMRTTRTKQLSERAGNLIKTYTQKLKGSRTNVHIPDEDTEPEKREDATDSSDSTTPEKPINRVFDILCSIHGEVGRGGGSRAHTTACSQASLLLVKVSTRLDRAYVDSITDLYAITQKCWLNGHGKFVVQPSFFMDFINWGVEFAKKPADG